MSPDRRQAIIWINARILLIVPLGTNFSEIVFEIYTFSFKEMHLNVSSGKWRPSCLCINVLKKPLHLIELSTKCVLNISQYCAIRCLVNKSTLVGLTHLSLDKMAIILAEDIFKCIFVNKNYFSEIGFRESSRQKVSIGSGNAIMLNRRIYVSLVETS